MTIGYHPAVRREIENARDYYDGKSPGLGVEFIDEFERPVLLIAATPAMDGN
jgi:hypothetical protein